MSKNWVSNIVRFFRRIGLTLSLESQGEVKETRAWKAVVEKIASGELAHAASVIKKVFELM